MGQRLEYPNEDWPLDNGGVVLWSKGVFRGAPHPKTGKRNLRVSYLCAARTILDSCNKKGDARASHVFGRRGQGRRTFRALHDECYRKILAIPDADKFVTILNNGFRTYELLFPKGTKALYHTRGSKSYMIAIECRACFKPEKCNFQYIHDSTLRLYIRGLLISYLAILGFASSSELERTTWCRIWPYLYHLWYWDEYCSHCAAARGSIVRFSGWKIAPSGTRVFFPEDKAAPALVHYKLCPCVRPLNRTSAINTYDELSAACRKHTRQVLEQVAMTGTPQAQNGNGPKNGEGTIGHRPRDDRDQWLMNIIDKLVACLREHRNLDSDDRLKLVSQKKVAFKLEITSDWLGTKIKECGLAAISPDPKKRFKELAAFVDERLDSTTQEIFSDLKKKLADHPLS